MMTVADYVERVRAALGDLPPRTRDELLEDLPEHLAEVAASGDEPLESIVGPPEAYAAELRAAANVETPARRAVVVGQVRDRLRVVDTRIGPLIGYASASEFGRQLRPAWWVVRGYLAAMVVSHLLVGGYVNGLLPRLNGGSTTAGLVVLAAFVVASIWLGRRYDRLPALPRIAIRAGTVALAVVAVAGFIVADHRWQVAGYGPETVSYDQYSHVQDVFVYDREGRLLKDVVLVDQDGRPIVLGSFDRCPGRHEPDHYPRCPELAPGPPRRFQIIVPSPTPSPSATG